MSPKIITLTWLLLALPAAARCADADWEKEGDFYFLTKDNRKNFSAAAAGANKFISKYLNFDKTDFLCRGSDSWNDYGRLDLTGNKIFAVPIRAGMKVKSLHLLAGGNVGNSYKNDGLLSLYGDNYYYATLSAIFAYQDNTYKEVSAPVFWDWFRLGPGVWSAAGASVKSLGSNPVRKDCGIFHIVFLNPRPDAAVKDILLSDSWVRDYPFSEVFALTLETQDRMEARPKLDRKFSVQLADVEEQAPDQAEEWALKKDLDGWIPGGSGNWGNEAYWEAEAFGKGGVAVIPACNWAGEKFSWIEKKVSLPEWDKIILRFARHSAIFSTPDKVWSDGLLRVTVKNGPNRETVYEKLYSGEWSEESADLSKYKGKIVIIRFENRGAGKVKLTPTTSPACDGEDAFITDIRLVK